MSAEMPSDSPHLLIAGAAPPVDAGATLPALPPLPNLDALLRRLRVVQRLAVDDADEAPATPHELALARAHGLPGAPGRIAWAAFERGVVGTPCAWLQPAHIQLSMDDVQLIDPAALELSEAESQALLAACAPLLAQDGLRLRHVSPGRWLAEGELLRGLVCTSPARAATRRLSRQALARADAPAQQRQLARLQSELEMLLSAHPVNQAREAARQWPANALWLHGAGALDAPVPARTGVRVAPQLTQGEAACHAAAHVAAWQAIDADDAAALLAALRAGQSVQLTLSGPRRALTLASGGAGLWQRVSGFFGRQPLQELRQQL